MSALGVNPPNTEFDAAQALLDLQSNARQTKSEYYREDTEKTAQLFLSCFIASNVTQDAPKNNASTSSVDHTEDAKPVGKSNTIEKQDSPVLKRDAYSLYYESPSEESPRGKKLKVLNASQFRGVVTRKSETPHYQTKEKTPIKKVKTREIGTQTDEISELPDIESMQATIKGLCEKIRVLEAQIKSCNSIIVQPNEESSEDERDISRSYESRDETFDDPDYEDESLINKSRMSQQYAQTPEHSAKAKKRNSTKVLKNYNVNANPNEMVPIGYGNVSVPSRILRHINWSSYTSATRKLLTAIFSRRVLATHSLTGKPSPAFPNKPAKKKLDAAIVNDIVQTVVERCSVPENVVRTSITTKCADESKMLRTRQQNKKRRKHKINRENIPPTTSESED